MPTLAEQLESLVDPNRPLTATIRIERDGDGWVASCDIEGEGEWAKVFTKSRGGAVVGISHYVSQL